MKRKRLFPRGGKFVLFLACLLAMVLPLHAQQQQVCLDLKNQSAQILFQEIQRQTGLSFVYNQEQVKKHLTNISIHVVKRSVESVLKEVLNGTGLTYKFERNLITILPEKKEAPAQWTIKGVVKDEQGNPLPGVNILVKGSTSGVISDVNGLFQLKLASKESPVLVFSFIGFETTEVTVKDNTPLEVVLKEKVSELDEAIVIGYGTTAKKDLTGSVARFDSKIIEESTATSVAHMMQGQIAGLSILAGDGAPGSPARLEIRGVPSLNGSTSPLIVVDNVPMPADFDINEINPQIIANVDILKGASSAAIYGSRAASGVILITTKTGSFNQKTEIRYNYDCGLTALVSKINTLTADEFKVLLMEAVRNEAAAAGYKDITEYSKYQTFTAPDFFGEANTPWMELVMRNGLKQQHNVLLTGGGKDMSFNVAFNYSDERGEMRVTDFKRYTLDASLITRINPWLKFDLKINGNISDQLSTGAKISTAAKGRPDIKAYDEDGSPYIHSYTNGTRIDYVPNPIVEMEGNKITNDGTNFRVSGSFDIQFLSNLILTARYTYQNRKEEQYIYYSSQTETGSDRWKDQKGYGRYATSAGIYHETEFRLSYNTLLKDLHRISAMGAFTYTREHNKTFSLTMTDFSDDEIQNAIWQGANPYEYDFLTGSDKGALLLSFIARIEYKYKDRYLLTGTIRSDGSSKFAPKYRWGTFPSLAVAWILSEEKFLRNQNVISFLKLRAGWGKSGNADVGEYGWRTLYEAGDYQNLPTIIPSQVGNDLLKWEATDQYDIGLDFGFLKQRISGSLGVYMKKTDGLLYPFTLAPSTGMTTSNVNFANIENKGIEFDITARIIENDNWKWQFGFNIGKNENVIKHLDARYVSVPGQSYLTNTILQEGKSMGLLFGYETDGLFRSQAEIDYYESLNPDHQYQEQYSHIKTIPGDLKLVDQNGDGYVNRVSGNYEDMVVLGCSRPDFEGGFSTRLSWKGFTLSLQGTFSFGADKAWIAEEQQFSFASSSTGNVLDVALKRWNPSNPDSKYPSLRLDYYRSALTDFAVHDASYIKCQNINLEYKFPERLLRVMKFFKDVRVFTSVNNVFTITSYPGPSPESWSRNTIQGASLDTEAYPRTRMFNFGLKVTLK